QAAASFKHDSGDVASVPMGWQVSSPPPSRDGPWALYPYGDSYTQAHVAFFMGITVIVCIFCYECICNLQP
ncbi:hypothetical protein OA77_30695, partial [Pseudomonas coronafaciens]